MRVVMLFILLCIKLGFPKFFKFYEFLKNRFQPFRRNPKRKSKKTKIVRFAEPKKNGRQLKFYQSTSLSTMRFYNRTAELEYYRNGMRNNPPTDTEMWASLFIVCSFISVIIVCIMLPHGTWFQCVSGAILLYLFCQVVVSYVNCE
ncbi:uncharacterized protein T069G_10519 [Trichoderma breve]|uniref:Uncharacterized protein n=1 Tax=Trichoderma breve TaxID=2034170 RepID=A0A9W9E521_9HYPO|nr:uncharacterized protein T069G_10519 [Trichoderma breve]KAJ4854961.1 hypothetical protein T069G_10519 [Trichoderma breve]